MINFATGILTCDRKVPYLEMMLRNFRETGGYEASDPVYLYKNHRDEMHLLKGNGPPVVIVGYRYPEPRTTVKECAWGHYQILRWLQAAETEYGLALEDDIKFAEGWLPYLEDVLPEIVATYGDRWIMQLYRFPAGAQAEYEKGRRWYEFDHFSFFGTQATLYPRAVLEMDLADWIGTKCLAGPEGMAVDNAVGHWARARGIPTVAILPSVVQHVGRASLITKYFHSAQVFLDPAPAPKDRP